MGERILIIEDDPTLGDILREKFSSAGYAVDIVTDGAIGLENMRKKKPDLVILDIMLPTLNGYEVLEARKKDPDISSIPVIIVSNSGQPVEISRAIALNAQDYFVKEQFNPDEILEKARAQLSKRASKNAASLLGKKILMVEDDKFLADVLAKQFSSEQCTVSHAMTGDEALENCLASTSARNLSSSTIRIFFPKRDAAFLDARLLNCARAFSRISSGLNCAFTK